MPEYLAPGVFVEETSFRSKSIEGVSTTTTGIIGPCAYGPIDMPGPLLTSLADFERTYGPGDQLRFDSGVLHNYLWHAARAFFVEGGKRLYVVRTYPGLGDQPYSSRDIPEAAPATPDGHARASFGTSGTGTSTTSIRLRARFPGSFGNLVVTFKVSAGNSIVGTDAQSNITVGPLLHGDTVLIQQGGTPATNGLFQASFSEVTRTWTFVGISAPGTNLELSALGTARVRIVTLSVTVASAAGATLGSWSGLAFDPNHKRNGVADSLFAQFAWDHNHPTQNQDLPLVMSWQGTAATATAADVVNAFIVGITDLVSALVRDGTASAPPVRLTDGSDRTRPTARDYEGTEQEHSKTGLVQMADFEDVSILAAPGSTMGLENGYTANATTITNLLIAHAQKTRAIAVLDSGDRQTVTRVREFRAKMDSSYAALYYPWVMVLDPITRSTIPLPPSGFVAGIYARNDSTRAVSKAPANEVVNLALGFEANVNTGTQQILNPEGINCFRFFEGRGNRLWGARTISSDPEWKYVNIRRYFLYLERSIDRGTQWAVFEPNGERLWGNVRRTIEDFLLNEWQSGALLGDKPESAFFVRCDRSTMTQNDLDNGRLVCLVGVAAIKPAEFVIFRVGQWTADRKA